MELTTVLLLLLIGIVIGVLLMALLNSLRSRTPASPPEQARSKGEIRLKRDERDQSLLVEIDGQVYQSQEKISPAQRQRLALAIHDLRAWLGFPAPQPSVAKPAATPVDAASPATGAAADLLAEKDKPLPEAGETSIAAQIDAILQEKLKSTPLAGRGIRLLELPDQGMMVMVGLKKYSDVSQVPDEAIRELIRQSVAEWEQRLADKR